VRTTFLDNNTMRCENQVHEDSSSSDLDYMSSSSMSGTSGQDHAHSTTSDERNKELRDEIIKQEEADVRKAKILVGIAFFICVISVSIAVFVFASQGEEYSFELDVSTPRTNKP
jgi:hypothetical protein